MTPRAGEVAALDVVPLLRAIRDGNVARAKFFELLPRDTKRPDHVDTVALFEAIVAYDDAAKAECEERIAAWAEQNKKALERESADIDTINALRAQITTLTQRAEAAEAKFESVRGKIAWHRDGIGPDVPVLQERYDALRRRVVELDAELATLRAAKEQAERELSQIDRVLGNALAFDGLHSRTEKVSYAMSVAAKADTAQRAADQLAVRRDELIARVEELESQLTADLARAEERIALASTLLSAVDELWVPAHLPGCLWRINNRDVCQCGEATRTPARVDAAKKAANAFRNFDLHPHPSAR